jgi:hypothetical protein
MPAIDFLIERDALPMLFMTRLDSAATPIAIVAMPEE